jgi:rhamnogalacturonan hydrolase
LIIAPGDYLVIENGENAEVYNMVLRGPFIGGLDGIDISGSNIWVHDVEVTNGDECVTVKVMTHARGREILFADMSLRVLQAISWSRMSIATGLQDVH